MNNPLQTPIANSSITIAENNKSISSLKHSKLKDRPDQLRNRILHYHSIIKNLYNYMMKDIKQQDCPQGQLLANNNIISAKEEAQITAHIRYLRERIAHYHDEISYLTGEGICD